jgi:hypothetical protein
MVYMLWYKLWVGAKPRPAPFPNNTMYHMKYMCIGIRNKERRREHWLLEFVKSLCGGEVRGSNPAASNILHINSLANQRATCGTLGLGHVSSYYRPPNDTCQHLTRPKSTNQFPPHHRIATSSNGTSLPRHRTDCTDRYSQHPKIFACLTWRTDRDISSIRTPFEKVNIPPESGR